MSVKASVSMTEQQDAFIKRMVAEGRYASASAVVQHSLELLRQQKELEEEELKALRAFFEERMSGPFISNEEGRKHTLDMIERKRAEYGL